MIDYKKIGVMLGRAMRRKQRRDALVLVNQECPELHWRSKLIFINAIMGSAYADVKFLRGFLGFNG